jgi:hypothetical protein
MSYKTLIFISFICFPAFNQAFGEEPRPISLQELEKASPLINNQGYLLLNLEVSGTAPSIEFVRIASKGNAPLAKSQKVKKRGKSMVFNLKGMPHGIYLAKLPEGLYQITQVNAPYFDLPFKINTENSPEWRFRIEQGKTNYIGHLVIEKERSTKYISASLFNRMARDLDKLTGDIQPITTLAPLTSGIGVRDDFFQQLNNTEVK